MGFLIKVVINQNISRLKKIVGPSQLCAGSFKIYRPIGAQLCSLEQPDIPMQGEFQSQQSLPLAESQSRWKKSEALSSIYINVSTEKNIYLCVFIKIVRLSQNIKFLTYHEIDVSFRFNPIKNRTKYTFRKTLNPIICCTTHTIIYRTFS